MYWMYVHVTLRVCVQDMSTFVRKVQFKLHESIPNPIRGTLRCITHTRHVLTHHTLHPVITRPPYEVGETGWGEFEIIIKVFFVDPSEKPVSSLSLLGRFFILTFVLLKKKLSHTRTSFSY